MKGRLIVLAAGLVSFLQIGFLVLTIQNRADLLGSGREITLQTTPVDPRDWLRGDYVTLQYDISRIPAAEIMTNRQRDGAVVGPVYVRLKIGKDGAPASFMSATLEASKSELSSDEIELMGESRSRWSAATHTVRVAYGLERFYVPEGAGRDIERRFGALRLAVRASVGDDGRAQIKALYDGDAPIYIESPY